MDGCIDLFKLKCVPQQNGEFLESIQYRKVS
jgi:hypothetical protein